MILISNSETSKELPSGNHLIDFFNTSEREIIIDDAQNTEMDMRTPMTSIPDSESVIEPSGVEMQGTSNDDFIQSSLIKS